VGFQVALHLNIAWELSLKAVQMISIRMKRIAAKGQVTQIIKCREHRNTLNSIKMEEELLKNSNIKKNKT
jgi:hypothetical protein